MEILKKIIFNILFILLLSNLVYAIPSIKIEINPLFFEGNEINFVYSILSSEDEDIKYIEGISCVGDFPQDLLEVKEVKLKKGKSFQGEYTYGKVDEKFLSSNCFAYLSVIEPYKFDIRKEFEVKISQIIYLQPKICKDSECSEMTKVFVKGDNIYIDYSSSVENPSVTAVLTYPDKTTKQLILPTFVKAEHIGNYELEIMASKQGYKTITKKELFGVIKEEAVIKPKEFKGDKYASYLLYVLIIVLLVVLIYITRKMGGISALGIRTSKSDVIKINNKINNAKKLIIRGNINAATSEYLEITKLYEKLPLDKKKIVYRNLQELYTMIK